MTDNQDEDHDEMAMRLPDRVTHRVNSLLEDMSRKRTELEEQTILEKQRREELERTDPRDLN